MWVLQNLDKMFNWYKVLAFDCLAVKQLDIKNKAMLIALKELQHDIRYFFSKNKTKPLWT